MAPGRIRRFFSRLVPRSSWLGRINVFRRRHSREQDRGRIQQCSDHDGTHSSEMPWCHEGILTQGSTQIQPGEAPVVCQIPTRVEPGPHKEVGDRHPSFCVSTIPPRVQKRDGPIVTSSAVQESSSGDEDGYLGDGDSSKDSGQDGDEDGCLGDWDSSKDGDRDGDEDGSKDSDQDGDEDGCLGDGDSSKDSDQDGDEDGCLGDGDSSKDSDQDGDEDGCLGDGDSSKDSDQDGLEERIPPDGEDQPSPPGDPFPLKKEASLPPKQQDDNLFRPPIPEQSPEVKKPLSSEVLQYNLQKYQNLPSFQGSRKPAYLGDELDAHVQVLIGKIIPPKDHNSLGLSSIPSPSPPDPTDEKAERPSRKRRRQMPSSPPKNRSERPSREQKRQLPRSESGKPIKNRSTQQGKKVQVTKRKKRRHRRRKAVSHGNNPGKGKGKGKTSCASKSTGQSHVQPHTSCGNAGTGHVTKRKKHSQPRDSSSSSSASKKSSESENDSSGSSSDSKSRQSRRRRARKRRNRQSLDNPCEQKEKNSNSDSSGEFVTAPEEEGSTNKQDESQGPKVGFVAGSDMDQHLESGDLSPDRKSLDSFASEDTISKQPTTQIQDHPKSSTPAQLHNTHPTQGLQLADVSLDYHDTPSQPASTENAVTQVSSSEATTEVLVPEMKAPPQPEVTVPPQPEVTVPPQPEVKAPPQPEVKAPPQPDSVAENKQKSPKDYETGGSSKAESTIPASQSKPPTARSDLPPVYKPFHGQAEEKPIIFQLLPTRTVTLRVRELRAQLAACSGIMPIRIHYGCRASMQGFPVEELLEVCAVGDLALLLNAVKILGAMLFCKLAFIQCGLPFASVLPAVLVDGWEEHEWTLVVDMDVTARDAETFRTFVMEIVRLISNLLEKWQTFHSTEKHPPQLISLLKCLCSTIEETLLSDCDEPGTEASRLLNYLVFELLTPFFEH